MRNVIIGMDSCLVSNDTNKSNKGRISKSAPSFVINRSGLIWIIAIGATLLVSANPAFGQFTVQPMKLEFAVTPGKLIKSAIYVRNFDPNAVYGISMSVVELGQLEDGAWDIIEPNDIKDPNSPRFGFDMSKLSSCSDWISLKPNNFDLDPLGVQTVEITLRVGRGVRGFFGAGIIAKTNPIQGVGDVSIVVRFFVPVIIEIQKRPARPKVQATDIGLEFIKASADYPARSMVTMSIANDGGTYSRIKPVARIWSFTDGHWRVIATTEFEERSIIPGSRFKLRTNIPKPLPSGKYKATGLLYVDGRRVKKIEKEIDFVGDTSIAGVAADAPIDLEPIDLSMEGMPGATRTATIKVYNASKETVNIQTAMGLPSILQIGAMGDVKGEDLDCTGWLKVTPEQFTLRGEGGIQTLRIVNTMPKDLPVPHPCYFSLLALWATYPDGQKAGHTTANICVRNKQIDASSSAVALKLTLQDLGESHYLVVARFGNWGMVHFVPIRIKAALTMITGVSAGINRTSTFLSGNPNLMLPFEQRDFSGILDFSYVPADIYHLAAAIEYAPDAWADKQIAVRVSIEGEQRIVEIIGIEEELNELVEIKWK